MSRKIITALDIGTTTVQTVVAERVREGEGLHILGVGVAPSAGVRRGAVVDFVEAAGAVRRSLEAARRASGVPIKSVWLAVDGSHVTVSSSRGVVAVSRADQEISPEDVRRALAAAETFVPKNQNKEILHMIPRDFKVDREVGIKDPVGMHGVRLEVDALIIECSAPYLKNMFKCVEAAGIAVEDYVFAPLAASEAVLTKRQKELGVMLVDIGGGSSSFVVFEEGVAVHAGVVPIGGNHITGDVAIGMRTHVDVAEEIKRTYGTGLVRGFPKRDVIRLAEFIPDSTETYSRRELGEIIGARLQDLFELLQKELRKINRVRLLPAGVVLVGGSSMIPGMADLTRTEIGLPAEQGMPIQFEPAPDEKQGPPLATALGVARWASSKSAHTASSQWGEYVSHMTSRPWLKWLKSFLP